MRTDVNFQPIFYSHVVKFWHFVKAAGVLQICTVCFGICTMTGLSLQNCHIWTLVKNLLVSHFNVLDTFLMVLMFPEANTNPSLKFTKLFLVPKANRWGKAEVKSERNVAQKKKTKENKVKGEHETKAQPQNWKMKSTSSAVPPAVTWGCLQKWANLHRLKH